MHTTERVRVHTWPISVIAVLPEHVATDAPGTVRAVEGESCAVELDSLPGRYVWLRTERLVAA